MRAHRVAALFVLVAIVSLGRAASAEETQVDEAPAQPKPPEVKRFVPTLALELGGLRESLDLRVPGARSEETRSDVRMTLALGLAHPVARLGDPRARIDGHASIGLGPTFQRGNYHVPIRENVTFAYDATSWLTLRGGLGLGLTIDASQSALSYAELGIPLGVTLWGAVEVSYRPYLSLPLGSEERDVFGGSRTLSAATSFQPLDIALRFRWTAIGF
ncbi:MAG: hypothetical protein JST00_14240 [Deltaproteobacteria bacterium]|nr:hypothetical protein [Deltaproteobacteria bacterium]